MKSWFSILFFLTYISSFGQEISIKNNELLEFLYKTDAQIESVSCQANVNKLIPQDDPYLRNYNQIIVKDSTGLYILIDGTGRVYKASGLKGKDVIFERIDSTHFYGYNGYALIFSSKDTLFSLGGGGFWRENGQLRYFNTIHHEWNIIPTNVEVPVYEVFHYNNSASQAIYYLQVPFQDEATGKEYRDYSMYRLDLSSRINHKLGLLNNNLLQLNSANKRYVNIPSLKGAMVSFNRLNEYLLCFQDNAVYKLKNQKLVEDFYSSSAQSYVTNLFAIGDRVYYTYSNDSLYKLHSFKISMNDFVKEPYPLFETSITDDAKKYALPLSFMLLISTGGLFYFKKKRKRISPIENLPIESEDESSLKFNAIENDLINKMIDASKAKKQFSVDDINIALGLGKKSLEIQKKGRTEAINRINHKFKVIYEVKEDLIERKRSEEDRRFYKYIISEEHARMVKK